MGGVWHPCLEKHVKLSSDRCSCIDLKDIIDLVFFEIIDLYYIINKILKFKEKTRFDLMYM